MDNLLDTAIRVSIKSADYVPRLLDVFDDLGNHHFFARVNVDGWLRFDTCREAAKAVLKAIEQERNS